MRYMGKNGTLKYYGREGGEKELIVQLVTAGFIIGADKVA